MLDGFVASFLVTWRAFVDCPEKMSEMPLILELWSQALIMSYILIFGIAMLGRECSSFITIFAPELLLALRVMTVFDNICTLTERYLDVNIS